MNKGPSVLLLIFFRCGMIVFWIIISGSWVLCQQTKVRFTDIGTKKRISEKKITDTSLIQSETDAVIRFLQWSGYPAAKMIDQHKKGRITNIFIEKGSPVILSRVDYDKQWEPFVIKAGFIKNRQIGKPFNRTEFLSQLDMIVREFENTGYPFASVSFDSIVYPGMMLEGKIFIQPGEYYVFDTIGIESEVKINQGLFQNITGLNKGLPYSQYRFDHVKQKLQNFPFISKEIKSQVLFSAGKATPVFVLKSARSNRFSGIAGLVPDNRQTGKTYITGELSLLLYNSFHQAEKIQFEWHKTSRYSQDLNCEMAFPGIYVVPVGLSVRYELQKQDTTYITNRFSAGIESLSYSSGLKGVYSYKSSHLLGNKSISLNLQNLGYTQSQYGLAYKLASLDDPDMPVKGFIFETQMLAGHKKYEFSESYTDTLSKRQIYRKNPVYEWQFESRFFYPVSGLLAASVSCKWAFMAHDLFNPGGARNRFFGNEMFQAGGLKSVRGFDEKSLKATSLAVAGFEIGYLFGQDSRLFLLTDYGYLVRRDVDKTAYLHVNSAGAGMTFSTRAGLFTLIYALGRQNGQQFYVKDARIHVGYIAVF